MAAVVVVTALLGLIATPAYAETLTVSVLPARDNYEAWPVLVRANNGYIVNAYASGREHDPTGRKSVVFRVSKDGGRTFGSTQVKGLTGYEFSIFSLGKAPNGNLVALVRVNKMTAPTYQKWRIYISTNHGLTWNKSGPEKTWPVNPNVISPILTLRNGQMIAHWNASPGTSNYLWGVMRSWDNGLTWSQGVRGQTDRADAYPIEGRMHQFSDGKIMMVARYQSATPGMYEAYSSDDGKTWTPPKLANVNDGLKTPYVLIPHGGKMLLYYFDRGTKTVRVRTWTGKPYVWSPSQVLYRAASGGTPYDYGYLHAIKNRAGQHVLTWYAGTATRTRIFTSVRTVP
jgi:hypothetical protein